MLRRADGSVLLARRPAHLHQGGLWEFPGGKLEPGESEAVALARELAEELGIVVLDAVPLIRVTHRYPECRVRLAAWEVLRWDGEPAPREGQPLAWVALDALADYPMPAADLPVLAALRPR